MANYTGYLTDKNGNKLFLDNYAASVFDNPTADINVSGVSEILSVNAAIKRGRVFVTATVYLTHDGGTPQVDFYIDGNKSIGYYASNTNNVYTFSTVIGGLSAGTHNISLRIEKGNASNVKVPAYTARNLTVVEI